MGAWIDLLDPAPEELQRHLPASLHEADVAQLRGGGAGGRPMLASHGDHVVGVLLVAVVDAPQNDVFYQEVDVLLTADHFLTVRKTTPGRPPYDASDLRDAYGGEQSPGRLFYRLADDIAYRYLDAVDDLEQEIGELEDHVESWQPGEVTRRVRRLRHQILHVRRTLGPMRDAMRAVADGRIALSDDPQEAHALARELSGVHDRLLRATEGLDLAQELLVGAREYYQAKVAQDQNEIVKRLSAIASILLVPTLIVGFYGQNFNLPEQGWGSYWGYGWSLALISLVTIGQVWYFRRRNWL